MSFKVTTDNSAILYATYDSLPISYIVFKMLSLTYQFIELEDEHGCHSINMDASSRPRQPAVTLTFDLQNLTRSSAGASDYTL